jgi:hypothetical protein
LFGPKLLSLLKNKNLDISGIRTLDLSKIRDLTSNKAKEIFTGEDFPIFKNVEVIRINSTKLDDSFLIEFFRKCRRRFPRLHSIENYTAQFITPAFLENLFELLSNEILLPENFDFSQFIFTENEHRLSEKAVKALTEIKIKG